MIITLNPLFSTLSLFLDLITGLPDRCQTFRLFGVRLSYCGRDVIPPLFTAFWGGLRKHTTAVGIATPRRRRFTEECRKMKPADEDPGRCMMAVFAAKKYMYSEKAAWMAGDGGAHGGDVHGWKPTRTSNTPIDCMP